MFYSEVILTKKGPLSRIWLAAHWDQKLKKEQVLQTDISQSADEIRKMTSPRALRLSGHLLLGLVRIYQRKVQYLFAESNDALVRIRVAFRPGVVDMPFAPGNQNNVPTSSEFEFFHEVNDAFESVEPELDAWMTKTISSAQNTSRPVDITLEVTPRSNASRGSRRNITGIMRSVSESKEEDEWTAFDFEYDGGAGGGGDSHTSSLSPKSKASSVEVEVARDANTSRRVSVLNNSGIDLQSGLEKPQFTEDENHDHAELMEDVDTSSSHVSERRESEVPQVDDELNNASLTVPADEEDEEEADVLEDQSAVDSPVAPRQLRARNTSRPLANVDVSPEQTPSNKRKKTTKRRNTTRAATTSNVSSRKRKNVTLDEDIVIDTMSAEVDLVPRSELNLRELAEDDENCMSHASGRMLGLRDNEIQLCHSSIVNQHPDLDTLYSNAMKNRSKRQRTSRVSEGVEDIEAARDAIPDDYSFDNNGGGDFSIDSDRPSSSGSKEVAQPLNDSGSIHHDVDEVHEDHPDTHRLSGDLAGAAMDEQDEQLDVVREEEDEEDEYEPRNYAQELGSDLHWNVTTINMMNRLHQKLNQVDTITHHDMCLNASRREAANSFFELLQLKTWDRIQLTQGDGPYTDIFIERGPAFEDAIPQSTST